MAKRLGSSILFALSYLGVVTALAKEDYDVAAACLMAASGWGYAVILEAKKGGRYG